MKNLKLMSFNLAMGAGIQVDKTLDLQAGYIRRKQADIVFLQEVDRRTRRSNRLDQCQVLSDRTGLAHFAFRKAMNHDYGEFGVGILSRYPLSQIERHEVPKVAWGWLPWNRTGPSIILKAIADVDGLPVQLLATHWPSDRTDGRRRIWERQEASRLSLRLIAQSTGPLIFGGDLNARFHEDVVQSVARVLTNTQGVAQTIAADCDPTGRVDFIFTRGAFRVASFEAACEQPPGDIVLSDHPILLADMYYQFVEITHIHFNPAGRDVDGEYVTIRNFGQQPVSVGGWKLMDLAGHTFTFPAHFIGGQMEVRVWTGRGTNDGSNLFWGRNKAVWNNTGDSAVLRADNGIEISRFTY